MQLPTAIASVLSGWTRGDDETIGRSTAQVLVFARGDARRFLKVDSPEGLAAEAAMLAWARGRVAVAPVVAYEVVGDRAFLLTEGLPGVRACDPPWADRLEEMIARVARGLRSWHDQPSAGCPVDRSPGALLAIARERVGAGLVDPATFEPQHAQRTPEQILARLEHRVPERYVPTLIHGDYALPNVLIDGDDVGFVDLDRAGVGDRHLDLAIAARSLTYNWGEQWVPLLFEHYGQFPDPDRITWYRLLDELF
jgi:aminoglycoside phosphotransferase